MLDKRTALTVSTSLGQSAAGVFDLESLVTLATGSHRYFWVFASFFLAFYDLPIFSLQLWSEGVGIRTSEICVRELILITMGRLGFSCIIHTGGLHKTSFLQ